eukprot:TRINITY_DN2317_c0_g2_i1.p1 TRINITY_DN2317_c0_g2~~TRINITY_DN2317_c0_g2_i1.p1  ORF type:complete len:208 (-),score=60.46 TRINITY_DN2317_c0_g2_i1:36-659(-)
MEAQHEIIFVTGNAKKVEELNQIMGDSGLKITPQSVDLPELQGEPEEIAKSKCKLAYSQVKRPVITEDTSLCYNALKGLPGPYIKYFLEKLGHEGLNKLLLGYEDKSAYAQCIFCYMDETLKEPIAFVGRTPGSIVPARGPNSFGWDPVFEPEGYKETYAEMDKSIKNTISHRGRSLELLKAYFKERSATEQLGDGQSPSKKVQNDN